MGLHSETPSETQKAETLSMSALTDKARRRLINVWTVVGVILLIGVALYVSGIISNAISIIVWTVVFVFILRGPVNWLDKHGVNRVAGTLLAYLLLIAVLGLLGFIIFSPVFGINAQFEDLAASLPSYLDAFQKWAMQVYEQYADILKNDQIRDWISSVAASVGTWVQSFATTTAAGVVAAGASLANIVMCVGFALVIAYWMLVDLPKLGREANRLISDRYREDAQMLHLTVTRVVGGYLKATLIQCFIIGVACGIMFALLGVPSPGALAVITGLLNIIPIVGPWLGGALAFVASVIVNPLIGVASLIGTIIIQQVVYTFVSPRLMGNSVDIHPALTFIALMAGSGIGAAMSGLVGALVGALLSIPLVAIMKSVFVYYFEKRTGRRIVSEDGVFFKGTPSGGAGHVDPMADAVSPAPVPTMPSGMLRSGLPDAEADEGLADGDVGTGDTGNAAPDADDAEPDTAKRASEG